MASIGGIVSIAWDVSDAVSMAAVNGPTRDSKKRLLVGAYSARAIATLSLISGQGGIAFSQAGAYFQWLAQSLRSKNLSGSARIFASWSNTLAGNRQLLLILNRMSWIGGVIAIVLTLAILIIDESAFEKWCDRCCFSRNSSKRYALDHEELAALANSISEIL